MSAEMAVWTGRVDNDETDTTLRWHQVIKPINQHADTGIAIVGFACDEGVRRNQGRTGASQGPYHLRKALANLVYHQNLPLYEVGDISCFDQDLEKAQTRLSLYVNQLLLQGHFPVVLGGGHEVAYGTWQGVKKTYPGKTIGIINFDAHFDLRNAPRSTSGSSFKQIAEDCLQQASPFRYFCIGLSESVNTPALFKRAEQLGVEWELDYQVSEQTIKRLQHWFEEIDVLYLTIDLDVLPACVMPAVSAPAAFGINLALVEKLVKAIADSGKLVAFDVAELNPTFDNDNNGAKVAARLIWSLTNTIKIRQND